MHTYEFCFAGGTFSGDGIEALLQQNWGFEPTYLRWWEPAGVQFEGKGWRSALGEGLGFPSPEASLTFKDNHHHELVMAPYPIAAAPQMVYLTLPVGTTIQSGFRAFLSQHPECKGGSHYTVPAIPVVASLSDMRMGDGGLDLEKVENAGQNGLLKIIRGGVVLTESAEMWVV